jgi:LuxR family maltose regulon positive regulatory protein
MSVITLLDMAHSYIALTDRVGAMTVVSQAQSIGQQRPALGLLGAQVEELRARVDSTAIILAGGSSLTAAELRLAPLLATHLTLQEIGSRLYVSRSTAKTQAVAIYHKLGVRSRGEAVDILRELGLIKM